MGPGIGYFGPHGGGVVPIPPRPVDPPIFQTPGFGHAPQPVGMGLPVPIPEQPQAQAIEAAQGSLNPVTSPIEHVIANFGIHPNSGLAHAMRAIHAALAAHLEAQATHNRAQVGRGLSEPGQLFFNPAHHPAPVAPVRPGPVLQ